jgi:hypothetical protein
MFRLRLGDPVICCLGRQTAKATDEISGHIAAMQTSTDRAISVAHNIQQDMQDISARSTAVAQSVGQQHHATSEITHSVAKAARGTSVVVTILGDVSTASVRLRVMIFSKGDRDIDRALWLSSCLRDRAAGVGDSAPSPSHASRARNIVLKYNQHNRVYLLNLDWLRQPSHQLTR